MFRLLGVVCALAVVAGAVNAETDQNALARTQARLTEQLNAVIAAGVEREAEAPAPPIPAPEKREGTLAAAEANQSR